MVIRRVSPVSVAKVAGALYAFLGLVFGAMFSLIAMAGGMAASDSGGSGAAFGAIFGIGAIVIAPIVYGGLGFVMTFIMAALYNVIAGMVGGVEVDLQ